MSSRAKQVAHDPQSAVDEPVGKKAAAVASKKVTVGAGAAAPDAVPKKKKVVKPAAAPAPSNDEEEVVGEEENIDNDLMDIVPDEEEPAPATPKKKKTVKTTGAAKKIKAVESAKKNGSAAKKTVGKVMGGKVVEAGKKKKTVNKAAVDALLGKKKTLAPGKRELREITKEMKRLRNTAIKPASYENMTRQVVREVHGKKISVYTRPIRHGHIWTEEAVHKLLNHASDAAKMGDKKSLWIDHLNLARKAIHGKHRIQWTISDPAQEYREDLPRKKRNRDITI
jgi:hypothetical protein